MNKKDFCMVFTNDEIIKYLINPLKKCLNINIRISSSDDIEIYENSLEKICFVSFDGDEENFSIIFYGYQTSIFICDNQIDTKSKCRFNEEFMFIDDNCKKNYTSSDTYKNIVYEGELNSMNHEEILGMFCDFITILNGAKQILVEENIISQEQFSYPKCNYKIKICNNYINKNNISFKNILFIINEDIV